MNDVGGTSLLLVHVLGVPDMNMNMIEAISFYHGSYSDRRIVCEDVGAHSTSASSTGMYMYVYDIEVR